MFLWHPSTFQPLNYPDMTNSLVVIFFCIKKLYFFTLWCWRSISQIHYVVFQCLHLSRCGRETPLLSILLTRGTTVDSSALTFTRVKSCLEGGGWSHRYHASIPVSIFDSFNFPQFNVYLHITLDHSVREIASDTVYADYRNSASQSMTFRSYWR
jgi:hypothetical protein